MRFTQLPDVSSWNGLWGPNARRAIGYLGQERGVLFLTAALALVYVPASLAEPYILYFLVERIVIAGRPDLLMGFLATMAPLMFVIANVNFLLSYTVLRLSRNLHCNIKSSQLDNLVDKGINFFRNSDPGTILFSFFNDSNRIGATLSLGLVNTALHVILAVLRTGILGYINPFLMCLYLLAVIPLQLAIARKVVRVAMMCEIDLKKEDEQLTARIESLLRGAIPVKALGFGAPMAALWKRQFVSRMDLDLRNMTWQQLGSMGISTLQTMGTLIVLFVGVQQTASGRMNLGEVLAFMAISARISPSLQSIMVFVVGLQEVLVDIERYYRILDFPSEATEFSTGNCSPSRDICDSDLDEIVIQRTRVEYGNGQSSEVPCDFAMRSSGIYVWTGPNGSGKTSIAQALAGLVPHSPGSILCGGRALSDFDPESIRRKILYLSADPYWPKRTLGENFANRAEGGDLDCVRLSEVLTICDANEILELLPQGMQSVLSDVGHTISRGQNQRLFLALALYRQPRILVLDEALSQVSEDLVRRIHDWMLDTQYVPIVIQIGHRNGDLFPDAERVIFRRIEVIQDIDRPAAAVAFAEPVGGAANLHGADVPCQQGV